MTILILPRKNFEKDIEKLDEKMQEQIAMFGTPIESISDEAVHIEIFPNRPDLLSYGNYINALKSFLGKDIGLKKVNLNKPEKDFIVYVDKSVSKVRPYTVCSVVKDLKLDDNNIKEIIDIQEKLHLTLGRKRKKVAIGIYPLEKIKFPISYKALNPEEIKFRPLGFNKELNGKQILSQHPAGKEYGYLLNNFDKFPVFIDSNHEILSMPPIINSDKTGKISLDTKDIFIECSGNDLNTLNKILNIIVLSLEFMGGKIYQISIKGAENIITPDFTPEKMNLSLLNLNKLLGLELKEDNVKKCLERMGYEYSKGIVKVPSYRADVLHEVDLIEDIAIAYGYDKFIPEIPKISTIGRTDFKETFKMKISDIFIGLGMIETMSYHLVNKDIIKNTEQNFKSFIEVKDSKTEYKFLRKDLTSCLLNILSKNLDVEYPQEIFQLGRVFDGFIEKEKLAVALISGNFTRLKQIIEYFSKMLDINLEIKNPKSFPSYFIDGRVAEIFFNNKPIGFLGEIHPKILNNFRLKMPVALFEISIDDILNN